MRCKCCDAQFEPKRTNKYTNDYEDLCPSCLMESKMAYYDEDKGVGSVTEYLDGYEMEEIE